MTLIAYFTHFFRFKVSFSIFCVDFFIAFLSFFSWLFKNSIVFLIGFLSFEFIFQWYLILAVLFYDYLLSYNFSGLNRQFCDFLYLFFIIDFVVLCKKIAYLNIIFSSTKSSIYFIFIQAVLKYFQNSITYKKEIFCVFVF